MCINILIVIVIMLININKFRSTFCVMDNTEEKWIQWKNEILSGNGYNERMKFYLNTRSDEKCIVNYCLQSNK